MVIIEVTIIYNCRISSCCIFTSFLLSAHLLRIPCCTYLTWQGPTRKLCYFGLCTHIIGGFTPLSRFRSKLRQSILKFNLVSIKVESIHIWTNILLRNAQPTSLCNSIRLQTRPAGDKNCSSWFYCILYYSCCSYHGSFCSQRLKW